MLQLTKIPALLLVVGVVFGAGSTKAAVLNLDFGPTAITSNFTVSPYHGVTSDSGNTTWNTSLLTGDVASGLLWGDGTAATGISYNLGSTNAANTLSALNTQPSSNSALGGAVGTGFYASPNAARDGIFPAGGLGTTLQFTGLPAGIYEIYYIGRNTNLAAGPVGTAQYTSDTLYAGASASSGDFSFLGYADPSTISYTSTNSTTWTLGLNYAKATVTLAAGEYLNLAFIGGTAATAPTDQRGFLNSLQLVVTPVPEPSTYALLGLGGLVFAYRRTRCR